MLLRKQGAMPADDFRKRRLLHAKPMVSGARWPPQAVNGIERAMVTTRTDDPSDNPVRAIDVAAIQVHGRWTPEPE